MCSLYPEHDKLRLYRDKSQAIGAFLDWLQNEKGVVLAEYGTGKIPNILNQEGGEPNTLYPIHRSIERWLALYFEIDLVVLEKEKELMLESLRAAQAHREG